jgi:hypothetical protein
VRGSQSDRAFIGDRTSAVEVRSVEAMARDLVLRWELGLIARAEYDPRVKAQ